MTFIIKSHIVTINTSLAILSLNTTKGAIFITVFSTSITPETVIKVPYTHLRV